MQDIRKIGLFDRMFDRMFVSSFVRQSFILWHEPSRSMVNILEITTRLLNDLGTAPAMPGCVVVRSKNERGLRAKDTSAYCVRRKVHESKARDRSGNNRNTRGFSMTNYAHTKHQRRMACHGMVSATSPSRSGKTVNPGTTTWPNLQETPAYVRRSRVQRLG